MRIYFVFIIIVGLLGCETKRIKLDEYGLFESPDLDKEIVIYNSKNDSRNNQIAIKTKGFLFNDKVDFFESNANHYEIDFYWLTNNRVFLEYPMETNVYIKETSFEINEQLVDIDYNPFEYVNMSEFQIIKTDNIKPSIVITVSKEIKGKEIMIIDKRFRKTKIPRTTQSKNIYGNIYIKPGTYRFLVEGEEFKKYSTFFDISEATLNVIKLK